MKKNGHTVEELVQGGRVEDPDQSIFHLVEYIGDRLREECKRRGLTPEAAAKVIGYGTTPAEIQAFQNRRILRLKRVLDLSFPLALAKRMLGQELHEFLRAAQSKNPNYPEAVEENAA